MMASQVKKGSCLLLLKNASRWSSSISKNGGFPSHVVNGNQNGDGKMSALSKFEDPSQLTSLMPLAGPVLGATVDKAYEFFTYGRFSPKPRMLCELPHEIVFEIPAPALDEAEIKMSVDTSNRFILIGENPAEGRLYKMSVKLPHDANFEKATFVAKLDRGLVRVTVTNFERKSVEVHFTK